MPFQVHLYRQMDLMGFRSALGESALMHLQKHSALHPHTLSVATLPMHTFPFSYGRMNLLADKPHIFLIIYSNYIPLLTLHIFSFIRLFSLLAVLRDTFIRSAHSSSGTSTHRMSNSVRSSSVKLHSASRYLISGIVNSQIFNFYPPLFGIRKIFNHAILGFFQIFHVVTG
nr:MAG TPA: hypothetical protein [Caudoviricetes sp.]